MLDINFIIDNKEKLKYFIKHKGLDLDFDEFITIYYQKRKLMNLIKTLREKKNTIAREIQGFSKSSEEFKKKIQEGKDIRNQLQELENKYRNLEIKFTHYNYRIPNIFLEDTPLGKDDKDNIEIRKWGTIPKFNFNPKNVLEIGEALDIIDIPRGVKVSGTKQYFLKNEAVFLEKAIFDYTINYLKNEGFSIFSVPLMVKWESLYGTGYFPLSEEETYYLKKDELFLIGTSEVSLCSYYKGDLLFIEDLPIKICSLSNCFRREAGTYGKIDQGLYRVHQFQKVEQVVLCQNDKGISEKLHYELLQNSENILQALEIPYRVVRVCSGDLGFGQVLKHDIESWMPSKGGYFETHSCSSFFEFQSRRLNIKYSDSSTKKKEYVYTINNTAIASPRILIPLLENNQQEDGSIKIPDVLRPYMGGKKYIK